MASAATNAQRRTPRQSRVESCVSANGRIVRNPDMQPISVEKPREGYPGALCRSGCCELLRAMIQVRGIAAELSTAAERELAQRTEACDRRLLVRHAISQSIVDGIAFAGLEPPGELVRVRVPCRCTPGCMERDGLAGGLAIRRVCFLDDGLWQRRHRLTRRSR